MITKIMEWVSITALLLVVSWRPVASYQIPLDFVGWGGRPHGDPGSILHQKRNGDSL